MDIFTFEKIINEQIEACKGTLLKKAEEYATEDRLHNFKVAATLQNVDLKQALAGMMSKHTVSIFDLCQTEDEAPMDVWHEKITDHINYLLLLRAVIEEIELLKTDTDVLVIVTKE